MQQEAYWTNKKLNHHKFALTKKFNINADNNLFTHLLRSYTMFFSDILKVKLIKPL